MVFTVDLIRDYAKESDVWNMFRKGLLDLRMFSVIKLSAKILLDYPCLGDLCLPESDVLVVVCCTRKVRLGDKL